MKNIICIYHIKIQNKNSKNISFTYFVSEIRKEEVLAIRNRFPTKIPVRTSLQVFEITLS